MAVLRYLVALGLALGFGLTLLGFADHWPADEIAPFRLQFVVLALSALLVSLTLKRRWLTGFAAIVLALNIVPAAIRLAGRPVLPARAEAPARHVALVFSNVLCDNHDYGRVVAMVRSQAPDLFAAAETTPDWIDHLGAVADMYPYHLAPADEGVFGVALYARRPFKGEVVPLGSRGMNLLRADFDDYVVYVAHPMPPANIVLHEDNRVYLQALADRVAQETRPVIVVGDMNATLWSNNLRPLLAARLQWPSGSGVRHTWPSSNPLLGIQIDQVLTRGALAGTYRVLPPVGSDHLPVRAYITLPAN